ncbi:MAG: glycine betaine/proline transport system substrate-binding protein [Candidatus Tokpelaia sp. JSC085]|nr:MAG: glycine betaine/proline transport system substrate-binding protein [Candidatus Tokpelaia sp. JSC085]
MIFYKKIAFAIGLLWGCSALAQEPGSCRTVRFAETGWTDIVATTAVTSQLLHALGYETRNYLLSVPVTYAALSLGDADVFLGYWKPSMTPDLRPYEDNGTVETVRFNLIEARYTLAVPQFTYDAGLKSIGDIARFADRLDSTIYGVEPGNDGNRVILSMIANDNYNLGKFRLIESAEQAMLSEVEARIASFQPIVFLGWEPHPMNSRFKMAYLAGGDEFFGSDYGRAMVGTNTRKGYVQECYNVGRLLQNLVFSIDMENELMSKILDHGEEPAKAADTWLRENTAVLELWLNGVKTWHGDDAFSAVKVLFSK